LPDLLIGRALAAPPNGARKTGKVAHIVAGTYHFLVEEGRLTYGPSALWRS